MRGDPELRVLVHLAGPDLHLDRPAFGTYDRGMQRLVIVGLRVRDIVIEFVRNVVPQAVHDTERGVTVPRLVNEDPYRLDIEYLVEMDVLALHLSPDAVDVLGSAADFRLDPRSRERTVQSLLDLLDMAFPVDPPAIEQRGNPVVRLGIQVTQRQVLELPLDLPDTQSVGQRSIDLQRLPGNAPLAILAQVTQRAHVVQAICEFDQHDAHIFGHRKQQLSNAFRVGRPGSMLAFQGLPDFSDPSHLGYAVDKTRNTVAKLFPDRIKRHPCIFDDIMKNRRGNRFLVEFELVDDFGDRQAMHQVGLTGSTGLLAVGETRAVERPPDKPVLGFVPALGHGFQPRVEIGQLSVGKSGGVYSGYHVQYSRREAPAYPSGTGADRANIRCQRMENRINRRLHRPGHAVHITVPGLPSLPVNLAPQHRISLF